MTDSEVNSEINSDVNDSPGLRTRQLCDRLHLDYRVVALSAKQMGLSTHDYLQQETGWVLYEELYYPPGTTIVNGSLCTLPLLLQSKCKP
jgi:hypothetical protein